MKQNGEKEAKDKEERTGDRRTSSDTNISEHVGEPIHKLAIARRLLLHVQLAWTGISPEWTNEAPHLPNERDKHPNTARVLSIVVNSIGDSRRGHQLIAKSRNGSANDGRDNPVAFGCLLRADKEDDHTDDCQNDAGVS